MSTLYYDFTIHEIEYKDPDAQEFLKEHTKHLPHFDAIQKWLPEEFDRCQMHKAFYGLIQDKVKSCRLTVRQKRNGTAFGLIAIHFIPGFRLNAARRQSCWDQMDAQMTDGFGETYELAIIQDVDPRFRLEI